MARALALRASLNDLGYPGLIMALKDTSSPRGCLGETSDPRARITQADREGLLVPARAYRTGEKAAGTSSLLACRIGRTPVCGGHAPPDWREASRTRVCSLRSLYSMFKFFCLDRFCKT